VETSPVIMMPDGRALITLPKGKNVSSSESEYSASKEDASSGYTSASAFSRSSTKSRRDRKASGKQGDETVTGTVPPVDKPKGADVFIFKDIHDWASTKRLVVSDKDMKTCEYGGARGWPITRSSRVEVRGHPISHLARDLTTLEVLKIEGRGKRELKVMDWFGAPRNRSLTPMFPPNGKVNVSTSRRPIWVSSRDALQVEFVSCPDTRVQGDAGRWKGTDRRKPLEGELFDFVLVQDVYFGAENPTGVFSPASVRYLSNFSVSRTVYVVCRLFVGSAGADECSDSEGVWYRNGKGLIIFSPDPFSAPYAAHPDINWLQHRHQNGVDVTFLKNIGPYSVFRCVPSLQAGIPLLTQVPLDPYVDVVRIGEASILLRLLHRIPGLRYLADALRVYMWDHRDVSVLVCLPLAARLNPIFGKRIPNGPTLDSALHQLTGLIEKEVRLTALRSRFPTLFSKVVEGTLAYVLYANRDVHLDDLAAMRCSTFNSEVSLIKARATANAWIEPMAAAKYRRRKFYFMAAGCLLGSVGMFVAYKNRGSLMSNVKHFFQPVVGLVKKLVGGFSGYIPRFTLKPQSVVESLKDESRHAELIKQLKDEGVNTSVVESNAATPFWFLAVVSPIAEESLRWFCPRYSGMINGIEVGYLWACGNAIPAVTNLIFHSFYNVCHGFGKWGVLTATLIHMSWNTAVYYNPMFLQQFLLGIGLLWYDEAGRLRYGMDVPLAPQSLFELMMKARMEGTTVSDVSRIVPLSVGVTVPPYTSTARSGPPNFRGRIKVQVDNFDVDVDDALELLSIEPRETNQMYPILITNGLLWEPANNEKNLLVAILWRTHADPFLGCDPADVRHGRWRSLSVDFEKMSIFNRQIEDVPDIEECARLMGKRGERILRADVLDQFGINSRLWKTISLKWNETLPVDKELGSERTMKPRAIVNLDPIIHSRMAGLSRAVAKVLHERLNGQVHCVYGVTLRIFFAAGYTQAELNGIVEAMQGGDCVLAISGDDSVVSWGPLTPVFKCERYGECDQSQFDHTQDDGPQRIAASEWLRLLGVPDDFIDLCYGCCSWPYTARCGRLKVKGVCGTQMPTGITMTTVLNSMSTLFMYLWIIKTRNPDFSDAARELGFKTKYKGYDDVGDITFLRGWWRLTRTADRVWCPLPSACLKLGKVLRPPVDICKFKHPLTKQLVEKTPLEAVAVMAYALSSSYGAVPRDYPIFGAFLQTLDRLGLEMQHPDLHSVYESWRPIMTDFTLDIEDACSAICRRYDLSRDDLDRVHCLLSLVVQLPSLVVDPVFDRLRAVDY